MTSDAKIQTNRANAQSSTGPKTPHGRGRSAKNALRFGLSLPVRSYPALSEEIEALAREIAGPQADPDVKMLARQVAEAQVDLLRVRHARHQLLSDALLGPHYDFRGNRQEKVRAAISIEALMNHLISTPEGLQKLAAALLEEAKLDRYERRALSRRKFAIRAFDERAGNDCIN